MREWSGFSAFSLAFQLVTFPHCSHSAIYLHFLMANEVEHFFMCLFAICIFRKMSGHGFGPFPNWIVWLLLSFANSLYILDTTPLSIIWFANIFSPIYNLSSLPLHRSFSRIKVFFNLDEVHFASSEITKMVHFFCPEASQFDAYI